MSRVLGFGREALIASLFGTTAAYDLFILAGTIPDYLIAILVTALPLALIPIITKHRNLGHERALFARGFIGLTVIIMLTGAAVWLLRIQILELLDSRLTQDQLALGGSLALPLLGVFAFSVLDAYNRSWLYEQKKFWVPATSAILLNLLMLALLFVWHSQMDIAAFAWTWCIACAAVFVYTGFSSWQAVFGSHPTISKPTSSQDGADSSKALAVALLAVVGVEAVALILPLVDRLFASSLGEGELAALRYASFLVQIPTGLLAVNYATASFPWLSDYGSKGKSARNDAALRDLYGRSIRMLLFVSSIVALAMIFFSEQIVSLAFQRGAFDSKSLALTSDTLLYLTFGLPFYAVYFFQMRLYYAHGERKRLAILLIAMLMLKILLNFLLVDSMQQRGLALATTIAWFGSFVVMTFDVRRYVGMSVRDQLLPFVPKLLLALGLTSLFWYGTLIVWPFAVGGSFWISALQLGLVMLVGGGLFLGVGLMLKMEEGKKLIKLGR